MNRRTDSSAEPVCLGRRFTEAMRTGRGFGAGIGSSFTSSNQTLPSGASHSKSWIRTAAASSGAGAFRVSRVQSLSGFSRQAYSGRPARLPSALAQSSRQTT